MTDFNEDAFFNLLDEAEVLMENGFPLSDDTDLIDRIIAAAKPNPLIRESFETLYERINTFGEGELGKSLMINFFNVPRGLYNRTLSPVAEVEVETSDVVT